MPDPSQGILHLDVVVRDKAGKPVSGLTASDFTLLDNGQPQKLVSFQAFDPDHARPEPPVEIILVLDDLDLPPIQLAAAQREVENFIHQNQLHLLHPVLVYRVSRAGLSVTARDYLAFQLTQNTATRVIWKVPGPPGTAGWGNGPLNAAQANTLDDDTARNIPHALVALGSIAIEERRRPGRKLMVWLGPGWPLSRKRGDGLFDFVTELSTRLREARIQLWSASEWPSYDASGLPQSASSWPPNDDASGLLDQDFLPGVTSDKNVSFGNLALQVVATQTGGGVLTAHDNLAGLIQQHVDQADASYTLTFDPPATRALDEYHTLKIELDQPGLSAATSTAYYDEPVFYDQPPPNTEHVTVDQLQQTLNAAHGEPDSALEHRLSTLELTERLSTARLAALESSLRGKKSRQALIALADRSVFLPPPAADIASIAPPDPAAQQQIFAKITGYLSTTIPHLPNFFATRTTVRFEEPDSSDPQTLNAWKTLPTDPFLHEAETARTTVLMRNGRETVTEKPAKGKDLKPRERTLDTIGTFGPILGIALLGIAKSPGSISFSRWENTAHGLAAVFAYNFSPSVARFEVGFCCLARDDQAVPFDERAAPRGEIAVDPATGAILRITVQANLAPRLPLEQSGIMVEYGPVTLGGSTYVCPARSVSISRQRTLRILREWGETFKVYGHFETILNDMAFEKYHLFHSESRILPDFTPSTDHQ